MEDITALTSGHDVVVSDGPHIRSPHLPLAEGDGTGDGEGRADGIGISTG